LVDSQKGCSHHALWMTVTGFGKGRKWTENETSKANDDFVFPPVLPRTLRLPGG
jgi:hypothetical protein